MDYAGWLRFDYDRASGWGYDRNEYDLTMINGVGGSIYFVDYVVFGQSLNMLEIYITNIRMGFIILCQVEDFEYFFKITLCTCVFEKSY